jgi:ribosomal protein L16 Arg81 hydroxylase
MISTLQDLIDPLTEAEFLTHIRERTVAFIRASEPSRFQTLLDWDELNHLVENGRYPIEELRVQQSMPIPASLYIKQGQLDPAAFSSFMDRGACLTFNRLDQYVSRLSRLCHQIAEQTAEQVTAQATVTSASDGARPDVNTQDICVLQIAGSNRWKLYGPPIVNALPLAPPAPQSTAFFNEILRAGDFLYLPAGYWHRCEMGSGRSLHVCILSEAPCGRDVVDWLTGQLKADETFNEPLTRFADASALASHEAVLKARLIEQLNAWSLAGFLAERAAALSKKVVIRIQGTQVGAEAAKPP